MPSILRRLFSFGRGRQKLIRLAGPGVCAFNIVGESFYQKALGKIAGRKVPEGVSVDVECYLVPDRKNKHDPNAVLVEINRMKVGYLSRQDALEFRESLEDYIRSGCSFVTYGIIMGGFIREDGSEGHFGVRLDLDWPPEPEDADL